MALGDLNELNSFTLDEYVGATKAANETSYSGVDNRLNTPTMSNITSYPDSLVIGDRLFPMLYIYYMGNPTNKAKIGDEALFTTGIENYFSGLESTMTTSTATSSFSKTLLENNLKKFYHMFVSAVNKNRNFLFMLGKETTQLMSRFRSRLPKNKGSYYSNELRTKFDYFPIMEGEKTNTLEAIMETFRILFENGVISYNLDLGVRAIDLYTGGFADENEQLSQMTNMARSLGLPTKGMFTINNRPRTDPMFRTFSGIDIITLASLDTVVTQLEGLTQLSWSVHRGKTPHRVLGKPTSPSRASGSRTIAGSFVFTLTDHHPLLDLLPGDYPVSNNGILESNQELWQPLMMSDQLPPFDLMVTMTNEYGYASIVSLYGIEIVDEGTVIGVDNLVTECVIQYTAVAMDPIMAVQRNADGTIDPYGVLQAGYSKMWKHRETVVQGVTYSDLEVAYESQYDGMFSTLQNRVKSLRDEIAARRQEEKEQSNSSNIAGR